MKKLFGYRCEYCDGIVKARRLDREAFKHKSGFVILEEVTIGVCDQCGNRYYSADVLKRVEAIATGKVKPKRTQRVPVAHAV
jgi:YgiT-type zinc finger domain-containing protein